MDENLYKQASRIENAHPEKALRVYRKLERDNLEARWDVLLIVTISPLIGFLTAFFIGQSLAYQGDAVKVVIWCAIGFAPVVLYGLQKDKLAKRSFKGISLTTGFMIFLLPFVGLIQLFIMCFLAAIIALVLLVIMSFNVALGELLRSGYWWFPTLWTWGRDIPDYVLWPTLIISFVFSFIYFSTKIPLERIFSIRSILLAIKSNLKAILFWLLPILLALMLGGGYIGFFFDNVTHGVILNLVTGITLGITFALVERDEFISKLYQIVKIRCLIRMHRNFEAEFLLTTKKREMQGDPTFSDHTIWYLTCALLHTLKENQREDALECINKALSSLRDNEYKEILFGNIRKTKNFILKYS